MRSFSQIKLGEVHSMPVQLGKFRLQRVTLRIDEYARHLPFARNERAEQNGNRMNAYGQEYDGIEHSYREFQWEL